MTPGRTYIYVLGRERVNVVMLVSLKKYYAKGNLGFFFNLDFGHVNKTCVKDTMLSRKERTV